MGHRQVAARSQGVQQAADDLIGFAVVQDVPQHAQHRDRDRLGEIQRPGGPGEDVGRVVHIRVNVIGDPLRGTGQQRPGVRQHQRVIVHIHDPGLRCHPLGHLMGIVRRRQAGADIQELADPRLTSQEPHHPP